MSLALASAPLSAEQARAESIGYQALACVGKRLPLQVLCSAAGHYIGTADAEGPVSRESANFRSHNAATRRASTARPTAAAMQHASTIDLSKSLFIRVLYAMPRAGEAPPGATVTFLSRGKSASIARASGGFASAPSHS